MLHIDPRVTVGIPIIGRRFAVGLETVELTIRNSLPRLYSSHVREGQEMRYSDPTAVLPSVLPRLRRKARPSSDGVHLGVARREPILWQEDLCRFGRQRPEGTLGP